MPARSVMAGSPSHNAAPLGRRMVPAAVFAGTALVVLWALAGPALSRPTPGSGAPFAVAAVYLVSFGALAFNLLPRLAAVTVGAFGCVAVGIWFRFYSPPDALIYLGGKTDTLILLVGVAAVTALLSESGWFEVVAARILRSAGPRPRVVFLRLCLVTFVLSMFVNNLATILVLIPISVRIADELKMDAVGLILGEIVASNLGGASTMVGDFPNMLLATEVGLPFHMFLLYLVPITSLQLGLMLWYLAPTFPSGSQRRRLPPRPAPAHNRSMAARGQIILAAMVVGFLIAGLAKVSPAPVAAIAAFAAFAVGTAAPGRILRAMHLQDAAFFAYLFVMVGAISASGALDGIGESVAALWADSPAVGAVVLAWGAALITCVLNAGPTTALLIHILAVSFGTAAGEPAMWWAVSLGVCAGSSATLTGATAGPIAAGLVERSGHTLSFGRFAKTGIPLMLMFLGVTSTYLALLLGR